MKMAIINLLLISFMISWFMIIEEIGIVPWSIVTASFTWAAVLDILKSNKRKN